MKILVTGGYGFLGGRIAAHLCHNGHTITIGSRYPRALPSWLGDGRAEIIDWDDQDALRSLCKSQDAVIHAAGMNARDSENNPVLANKFNGEATGRLIDAAIEASVDQFIYLSTAHVYHASLSGEIFEGDKVCNQHPYAASHAAGENAILSAAKTSNIKAIVLRISNGFGPPIDTTVDCWSLFVNDICRQIVETGTIKVKNDGGIRRDFISVTKLCNVINELLYINKDVLGSRPVNVSEGTSMSLWQMANLVKGCAFDVLGTEPELSFESSGAHSDDQLTIVPETLQRLGLSSLGDNKQEIRNLLLFCHLHFSN